METASKNQVQASSTHGQSHHQRDQGPVEKTLEEPEFHHQWFQMSACIPILNHHGAGSQPRVLEATAVSEVVGVPQEHSVASVVSHGHLAKGVEMAVFFSIPNPLNDHHVAAWILHLSSSSPRRFSQPHVQHHEQPQIKKWGVQNWHCDHE